MTFTPKEIKEKVKRSRRKNPYTHDFKVDALLKLRDNNMDIAVTAKELGIKSPELSKWKFELGKTVYAADNKLVRTNLREINNMIEKSRKNLIITNNEILERSVECQYEVIERIKEVVKSTNNLFALSSALKILHEITTHKMAMGDDGQVHVSQTNQFNAVIENTVLNLQRDLTWKEEQMARAQSMPPSPLED